MTQRNARPRDDQSRKAGSVEAAASTSTKVTDWAETYTAARRWVEWNARRRWPDYAANDDVWALSAAAWWYGGTVRHG